MEKSESSVTSLSHELAEVQGKILDKSINLIENSHGNRKNDTKIFLQYASISNKQHFISEEIQEKYWA